MRHFVVLGFSSHSKEEAGESLYLGADRQKAIETANDPKGKFARKEVHELANPHMRRHFETETKPAAKKTAKG